MIKKDTNSDNGDNNNVVKVTRQNPTCTHCLPTRFQHMANISIFLENNVFQISFIKSQCKEINRLFKKNVFEVVSILDIFSKIRNFNSYFVDEIKNQETTAIF